MTNTGNTENTGSSKKKNVMVGIFPEEPAKVNPLAPARQHVVEHQHSQQKAAQNNPQSARSRGTIIVDRMAVQ